MQQRRLTIYGAIAVATPLLVLANTLLSSANRAWSPPVVALQPLLEKPPRLYPAAQSLAMAYRAWLMHPYARIVAEGDRLFLEFYAPFNLLEQGPDLTLFLVTTAPPTAAADEIPPALSLGKVLTTAGKQRYPIPLPVVTSAAAALGPYRSVIIWCAELDAMVAYAPLQIADPALEAAIPSANL
ncbi:MAG TPA: DM13 domain-containing protein [Nodosilinea sp.]|nr:DM13 domain-containing protein [Nodosilinea sp.]